MIPRVLFVDHTAQLGGAELCLLDTARGLRSNSTVVLLSDGPFRARLQAAGIRTELLQADDALLRLRRSGAGVSLSAGTATVRLALRLAHRAREHDVLYANSQKAFVIAALAGLWSRRPVIWHLHDILGGEHFGSTAIRVGVLLANLFAVRVLANSEATAAAFGQRGGRLKKVRVVYNGIDSAPFDAVTDADARAVRGELGAELGPLVGMFGRFHPWKGQHQLVEALPHLPGVHAVFVGDALFGEEAYVEEVKRSARDLGVADRVHLLGFRADVARLMRAVDIVIHASVAPEPFGRVIVEAMLARRPVVATNAGGVPEIVVDGVTGILIEPGNPRALAAGVAALLERPDRRTAMGQAGYERARRHFSLDGMHAAVARELEEVAGTRTGPAE